MKSPCDFLPRFAARLASVFAAWLAVMVVSAQAPGELDLSFNPGSGIDHTVNAIVVQPDGKILIGGSFTTVKNVVRNGIARLNPDGSADTTFDPGMAIYNDGAIYIDGEYTSGVIAIVLQPDGKILIGGTFGNEQGLARLNPTGTLDRSFKHPDWAPPCPPCVYLFLAEQVTTLLLQPDGKILIAGPERGGGGYISYFPVGFGGRFNPDGTEAGFNLRVADRSSIKTMAMHPDGKVVIAGTFTIVNDTARKGIARLHADGSLDESFDPGIGANEQITVVMTQPDGKALIAGGFTMYQGSRRSGMARLNADGTLDESFDPGTGANGLVEGFVLQPDGKVLIRGRFTTVQGVSRNQIARLGPDGSLDRGFSPGTTENDRVESLAVQTDGKILLGGWLGSWERTLIRLNSDGSFDTTFDTGTGVFRTGVPALRCQPDGKLLAGGFGLIRLNTDGSQDTNFYAMTYPGTDIDGNVERILLQPDGRTIIIGWFTRVQGVSRNQIARLNSDGTLDPGFDPGPSLSISGAVALQSDGKILIGGTFDDASGTIRKGVVRLNADGSLDPGFHAFDSGDDYTVRAMLPLPDARVIVSGTHTPAGGWPTSFFVRLHPDGSADPGFDPGPYWQFGVDSMVLQPDGKIIIAGYYGTPPEHTVLRRLHPDGSRDTSFDADQAVPPPERIAALALQPDGKLLVARQFAIGHRVMRLNADGSQDRGFATEVGPNGEVYDMVLQPDGKLLIGGTFTAFGRVARWYVARLHTGSPPLGLHLPLPELLSDGSFRLTFRGVSGGGSYILQSSSDLVEWVDVVSTAGEFSIHEEPSAPQLFYRVREISE